MKTKDKTTDIIFGLVGTIMLIIFLIFFYIYFQYVDIGSWLAEENYTDRGEWLKQLGLFVASMVGFYHFFTSSINDMFRLPIFNKNEKTTRSNN